MDTTIFQEVVCRLDRLMIYTKVKEREPIRQFYYMAKAIVAEAPNITEMYYRWLQALVVEGERLGIQGDLLQKYSIVSFLEDENLFSLACEKKMETTTTTVAQFAREDISTLRFLMALSSIDICKNFGNGENIQDFHPMQYQQNDFLDTMAHFSTEEELFKLLGNYYRTLGCGQIATYPMLKYEYDRGIIGIDNWDETSFGDLIGYDYQKMVLKENTLTFLNGQRANNVLLIGARGTGKSSCIKALATAYFHQGLRIIEITKEQLLHMSSLLALLSQRGKYFIIFMDDLSFEEFETDYKYLKSILEGSVEKKPSNVLFYATSNRRHLIKEVWKDRSSEDEVHTSDTLNEKISLSDRFGITLTFGKPTPEEYLQMVAGIAEREGVTITEELLKKRALEWEVNQKSYSGRTARQFIDHLMGQMDWTEEME